MKGLVHIYCGDGKGKTTAALGLAVRAAGRGKRVLIARFLKTDDSGEVPALARIPGIRILPCEKIFGFYSAMTEEQKEEAAVYYETLLERAWGLAEGEAFDMLILDEIMAACRYGLADQEYLIRRLQSRREELEVVLTGRGPSEELIRLADYVSEIRNVKHPYEKGVPAREGIEY